MLAIIDVSGSMANEMPGAGGQSRWQVVTEAARHGLSLIDDTWSVGLWTFATRINGSLDYLPILPIRSMTEQRPLLNAAVDTLHPVPGGGTGLYDTVLAAYQEVQRNWDPNSVNSVVIMTDGRNDDTGSSIDTNTLIETLKREADPAKPVPIIMVGLGDQVDMDALRSIAAATGGKAYQAPNPEDIRDVLLDAVSQRRCRPNC